MAGQQAPSHTHTCQQNPGGQSVSHSVFHQPAAQGPKHCEPIHLRARVTCSAPNPWRVMRGVSLPGHPVLSAPGGLFAPHPVSLGAFALTVSTNCPSKRVLGLVRREFEFNILPYPFSTLPLDLVAFAWLMGRVFCVVMWSVHTVMATGVSPQDIPYFM